MHLVPILALAFAAQAASLGSEAIVTDTARNVEVRYEFAAADVLFSAQLPSEWDFSVVVDGNEDGQWGLGPRTDLVAPRATADLKFGVDADDGFCAQYVLSSHPAAPEEVFASSRCGGFRSRGGVTIGPSADGRRRIALRLPMWELFGGRARAHLQICIWDTRRTTCHYSPARPFILRRPFVA